MSANISEETEYAAMSGTLIIGYILNWGFYGMLVVQSYLYYVSFPRDITSVKSFVAFLFLMETAQSCLLMRDAFNIYGSGYGNPELLEEMPFNWLSDPIMCGITSCAVQCFFAYRISILSGRKLIGLIVCAFAVAQGVGAIVVGIQLKELVSFPNLETTVYVSKSFWMAGSAFADILIAGLMTYFLSTRSSGLRPTRLYVNRLIRLFIETGSVTALVATIDLILFFALPRNNFHMVPCLILSKLYANNVLTILNSRMHIQGGRNSPPLTDMAMLTSIRFGAPNNGEGETESQTAGVREKEIGPIGNNMSFASVYATDINVARSFTPVGSGETHKVGDTSTESVLNESVKNGNIV